MKSFCAKISVDRERPRIQPKQLHRIKHQATKTNQATNSNQKQPKGPKRTKAAQELKELMRELIKQRNKVGKRLAKAREREGDDGPSVAPLQREYDRLCSQCERLGDGQGSSTNRPLTFAEELTKGRIEMMLREEQVNPERHRRATRALIDAYHAGASPRTAGAALATALLDGRTMAEAFGARAVTPDGFARADSLGHALLFGSFRDS